MKKIIPVIISALFAVIKEQFPLQLPNPCKKTTAGAIPTYTNLIERRPNR